LAGPSGFFPQQSKQRFVPDALRIGHEAHFAQMSRRFLDDVEQRRPPPAWEKPNTLAKYYVCTEGVAVSQI
jgi:hypothetical protein